MSLSNLLTSNSSLAIIWLLSNVTDTNRYKTERGIGQETFNESSSNNIIIPTKLKEYKNIKKRDIINLSIHGFLNNYLLIDQIVNNLNLIHQGKIVYGLTMCYNKQIEYILMELLKTKTSLTKELHTSSSRCINLNNHSAKRNSLNDPFLKTTIFDGTKEYKTIFELQQNQINNTQANLLDLFNGRSNTMFNNTKLNYSKNNFLQDDPVFSFTNHTNEFEFSILKNTLGTNEKNDHYTENNKLVIKQYDLSKELDIPISVLKTFPNSRFNYIQNAGIETSMNLEEDEHITNFEVDLISESSNINIIFDDNVSSSSKKRKRRDSFLSVDTDFEIDLINTNMESSFLLDAENEQNEKSILSEPNQHPNFNLFDQNLNLVEEGVNSQNSEIEVEDSELEDETNHYDNDIPPSSPTQLDFLSKGILLKNDRQNVHSTAYKKIKLDQDIALSNSFLQKNNDQYLDMIERTQIFHENTYFQKTKSSILKHKDLTIGVNLNVLNILQHLNKNKYSESHQAVVENIEIGRKNNLHTRSFYDGKNKNIVSNTDGSSDNGSVVSSIEQGRRLNPTSNQLGLASSLSNMNDIYELDLPEENMMDLDLNIVTTSSSQDNISSLNSGVPSSQKQRNYITSSSDILLPVQTIYEDLGNVSANHVLHEISQVSGGDESNKNENNFANDKYTQIIYAHLKQKFNDTNSSYVTLDELMSNITKNKNVKKKIVSRSFYAILQLATKDMIYISYNKRREELEVCTGDEIYLSLKD